MGRDTYAHIPVFPEYLTKTYLIRFVFESPDNSDDMQDHIMLSPGYVPRFHEQIEFSYKDKFMFSPQVSHMLPEHPKHSTFVELQNLIQSVSYTTYVWNKLEIYVQRHNYRFEVPWNVSFQDNIFSHAQQNMIFRLYSIALWDSCSTVNKMFFAKLTSLYEASVIATKKHNNKFDVRHFHYLNTILANVLSILSVKCWSLSGRHRRADARAKLNCVPPILRNAFQTNEATEKQCEVLYEFTHQNLCAVAGDQRYRHRHSLYLAFLGRHHYLGRCAQQRESTRYGPPHRYCKVP